jgi:hypothetical protein
VLFLPAQNALPQVRAAVAAVAAERIKRPRISLKEQNKLSAARKAVRSVTQIS